MASTQLWARIDFPVAIRKTRDRHESSQFEHPNAAAYNGVDPFLDVRHVPQLRDQNAIGIQLIEDRRGVYLHATSHTTLLLRIVVHDPDDVEPDRLRKGMRNFHYLSRPVESQALDAVVLDLSQTSVNAVLQLAKALEHETESPVGELPTILPSFGGDAVRVGTYARVDDLQVSVVQKLSDESVDPAGCETEGFRQRALGYVSPPFELFEQRQAP